MKYLALESLCACEVIHNRRDDTSVNTFDLTNDSLCFQFELKEFDLTTGSSLPRTVKTRH